MSPRTRRADRGPRHRHAGRRRRRGPGADARVRRARRRACRACAHRHGQVDDQPHDPGRRRRGTDQDGAGAAPPGAAADAALRASPTRSSSSSARRSTSTPRRGPGSTAARSPRRAGVNAFGFGGINAHAVLEECDRRSDRRRTAPPWDSEVCILEAGVGRPSCAERAQRAARARWRARARFTLADLALHAQPASSGERRRRGGWRSSRPRSTTCATKLAQADREAARPGLRADQDDVAGSTTRREPLGPRGEGRVRVPGRGRAVPEHARRPVPALPRGARRVRPDRPALRRPPARAPAQRLGVPAAGVLRRRSAARTEARLMELDIAVESVLTANAAVHAVLGRLVPPHRRAASATAPASTRRRWRRARSTSRPTIDLATLLPRPERVLRRRRRPPRRARRAVLLALGADAEAARGSPAQAGGELYLAMDNCPHQAVLVGDAERGRPGARDRRRPRG